VIIYGAPRKTKTRNHKTPRQRRTRNSEEISLDMDGVRKVVKDMEMALQHLADATGEIRRTNDQPIAWIGLCPCRLASSIHSSRLTSDVDRSHFLSR